MARAPDRNLRNKTTFPGEEPTMRRQSLSLCAGLIFALALPASAAQVAGLRDQVAEDAQSAPPTQLPPSTKEDGVIKPTTDVDPQIEKTPPEPNPDPAGKDVIKPPSDGSAKPK
jgi:hypothetical protein